MKHRLEQLATRFVLFGLLSVFLFGALVDKPVAAQGPSSKYSAQELFRGLIFGAGPVAALLPELWDSTRIRNQIVTTSVSSAVEELGAKAAELRDLQHPAQAARVEQLATELREGTISLLDLARMTSGAFGVAGRESAASLAIQDKLMNQMSALDPSFFGRFAADISSGDHVRIENMLNDSEKLLLEASGQLAEPSGSVGGEYALTRQQPVSAAEEELDGPVAAALVIAIAVVLALAVSIVFSRPNEVDNALQHDTNVDMVATRLQGLAL